MFVSATMCFFIWKIDLLFVIRKWYEKGAELGDVDCMERIALMYENGADVEQNAEKAAEWYAKAEEASAE